MDEKFIQSHRAKDVFAGSEEPGSQGLRLDDFMSDKGPSLSNPQEEDYHLPAHSPPSPPVPFSYGKDVPDYKPAPTAKAKWVSSFGCIVMIDCICIEQELDKESEPVEGINEKCSTF